MRVSSVIHRVVRGWGLSWVAALGAVAQTATFYVNDGVLVSPPDPFPQVDAVNFVNNNFFGVNQVTVSPRPYYTAHTLNFTNRGTMAGNLGFDLSQYVPEASPTEQFRWASTVHNIGLISLGTTTNSLGLGLGKLLISATNVYSPGSIVAGQDCFVAVAGRRLDFSHGLISMEGFRDQDPDNLVGLFSGYWGVGADLMGGMAMPAPITPLHSITNRYNQAGLQALFLPNALGYSHTLISFGGSNVFTRVVFLRNTNLAMSVQVYMPDYVFDPFPPIIVEWKWSRLGLFETTPTDDYLYLEDTFGDGVDYGLALNDFSGPRPTFRPTNFTFFRGGPRYIFGAVGPESPNQNIVLPSAGRTNASRAWQALFVPTTVIPQDTAGQNATNMPGRIILNATETVSLNYCRIAGPNTLELTATNHFAGSHGGKIAVPLAQITAHSTNGLLAVTNLMWPVIPRPEGHVDLYTCRWTNVVNNITNIYHVLFVNSELAPTSPGRIQDLNLSATNLLVSDQLHITRYFIFDGTQLTITTNAPSAPTAAGGIDLESASIIWSTATPRLSYLTNHGSIVTRNVVYFGGSRRSPFYSTNYDEPYQAFVNRGVVTNEGNLIWSRHFENTGVFHSGSGSLSLGAEQALLRSNGVFNVALGDITITAGDLLVSNHTFRVGRALTFNVTNTLEDGVMGDELWDVATKTNRAWWNVWTIGTGGSSMPGLSLPVKPARANLRATTITNIAQPYANWLCTWAGEDWGPNPAGFTNNAAIGRLILDGGENTRFTFAAAGLSNAIYVDYLELRNAATNRDEFGDLPALVIEPNMTVYYAELVAGGVSQAEKFNGRENGRLRWIGTYADGFFSSTNLVYPDNTTNRLNAALVRSVELDSDGDGLVNALDPTPVLRGQDLDLRADYLAGPPASVQLSWRTVAGASNSVWYAPSPASTNWQWLTGTNYADVPADGRATAVDAVTGGGRFYRVRVDVPNP